MIVGRDTASLDAAGVTRAAAKLDDVVNYIPARISAWLMTAAITGDCPKAITGLQSGKGTRMSCCLQRLGKSCEI